MTVQASTRQPAGSRHDRTVVLAGLTVLSGLAWAYLISLRLQLGAPAAELAAPCRQAWTAVDVGLLLVMWTVMMIAMMVPTTAVAVLTFASVNRRRSARGGPYVPTALFVGGYVLAWTGFSVLATGAQWGLHEAALLSPTMVATSPILGSLLLVAAGVFQWTSLKHACLRHCRSPLTFLMAHWHEGRAGALVMGLRHGLYCTGCCALLMALLFVAGVMNLLWVAALTTFVLVEKILPGGELLGRSGGALLVVAGLGLLVQALG